MYRIIRFYKGNITTDIVADGLTLEEAQEWCTSEESSSATATSPEALARTEALGDWFDGYQPQDQ